MKVCYWFFSPISDWAASFFIYYSFLCMVYAKNMPNLKTKAKDAFTAQLNQRLCYCRPIPLHHMSRIVRKPTFRICENKDADQLHDQLRGKQRLCFCYLDSTIPLLPKWQRIYTRLPFWNPNIENVIYTAAVWGKKAICTAAEWGSSLPHYHLAMGMKCLA